MHIIESYFRLKEKLPTDKTLLGKNVYNVLDNIHNLNKDLNAYVRVYEDELLQSVKDFEPNKNLSGMLVGLKDLICYKDHINQASSKILENFTSQINATVTQRIIDNGGLIVGHQNCDEFGMGAANEYSCYGAAHNGLDLKKSPGGSSGGSATAVQNNMCHVAIGTDTGGSVRQPAAFCGIVGFKPTYGRISRYGVIPYASSFDTVGILGKCVDDVALLLENVAGLDNKDYTSSAKPVEKYFDNLDSYNCDNFKIAYLDEILEHPVLQKEIYDETKILLRKLKDKGHIVENVHFKNIDYVLPVYFTITPAEAASNLERYDGIKYGYTTKEDVKTVKDFYTKTRTEGFGTEVKRRMMFGNYVLTNKGTLTQAQKVRRLIINDLINILNNYDFIIIPTSSTTSFDLFKESLDPQEAYLADLYTIIASIAGLPAISIPFGADKNNMPIGIQLISNHFNEQKILSFAKKIMEEIQP